MNFNYCSQCGKELILKEIGDEGLIPYCDYCHKPFFKNPVCSVLVTVINKENEVLLIKQTYVSKMHWVLVAGYVDINETLEQAVYREVKEETGLELNNCKYINSYYYDQKDIIMIGFVGFTDQLNFNLNSREVDDIKWVPISHAIQLLRDGSTGQKHLQNVINALTNS